jgi:hypothetical protein|tara:strand:- start:18 stop:461 length:444 start_codon:yes stop_codon:yes gene_type:complete
MERVDERLQGVARRRSFFVSFFFIDGWRRPGTFKVLIRRSKCRLFRHVVREEVPDVFETVLKVLKLFRCNRFEDALETVFDVSFANADGKLRVVEERAFPRHVDAILYDDWYAAISNINGKTSTPPISWKCEAKFGRAYSSQVVVRV